METVPIINYEETFKNSPNPHIVACNTEMIGNRKNAEALIKYLFTEEKIIDTTPVHCGCGHYDDPKYRGYVCEHCNTEVQPPKFTNIGYATWLEIPDFLPPILHPAAYHTLQRCWKSVNRKFLIDQFISPDGELPPELAEHFTPGYRFFYEHFDEIVKFLSKEYSKVRIHRPMARKAEHKVNQQTVELLEFLKVNKQSLFTRYLPALDPSLHMLSRDGTMTLTDKASEYILEVANNLSAAHLAHSYSPGDTEKLDYLCASIIQTYAEYSYTLLDKDVLQKPGMIKQHILASRGHFTFRAVISPITDLSEPDVVKIPWMAGVQQFRLELLNMLVLRHGYSVAAALDRIECGITAYDPLLDELFKTMIRECPYKGLPVTMGRNPKVLC